MKTTPTLTFLFITLAFFGCDTTAKKEKTEAEQRTTIEMVTDAGNIVLALYNETPLHRDNFVKLVNDGAYDSLLFHRVIENFMVQAGDPDSKNAASGVRLGNGDLPYKVDAEFHPSLFHKKGALGAARDGNLQRASSSMQFYIVQGRVATDSTLKTAEGRINGWLAEHYFKNDTANSALVDALSQAIDSEDRISYTQLSDSISNLAKEYEGFEKYQIPESHQQVYKSIGGAPHLDQNYTVFGEVVEGLSVIDSIAATATDDYDRPITDLKILSVRVLN